MLRIQWDIGDCLGTSWRPNFDTISYPYLPPHVTRPKECRKMFVVPLPDRALFAVSQTRAAVALMVLPRYSRHPVTHLPVNEPAAAAADTNVCWVRPKVRVP